MYRRRRSIFDFIREIEEDISRQMEWALMQLKEDELRSRCLEPLYTVHEMPDEFIVTVDIPGTRREDVKLRASDKTLYLEAPCSYDLWFRSHYRRAANMYKLEIELPSEIDPEMVTAKYKEGVLQIRAPKKERGVRIRIE